MLNRAIVRLLYDRRTKVLDFDEYLAPEQNLTEAEVMELVQHLPYSQIDTLNLSYVELTNKGFCAIINSLKRTHITHLTLTYNELEDDSVTYIANHLGNLTYLDLEGNNITNNGARALAQRLAGSSLQNLYLDDNNIIDANVVGIFRDALLRHPYMVEIDLPFHDPRINQYIERNNQILDFAAAVIHNLKDLHNISLQNIRALDKKYYQAFEIFFKAGKINLVWEYNDDLKIVPNRDFISNKIQNAISYYYPQITHIVSGEHMERDMAREASLADLESTGVLGEVFKYCSVADVHY